MKNLFPRDINFYIAFVNFLYVSTKKNKKKIRRCHKNIPIIASVVKTYMKIMDIL